MLVKKVLVVEDDLNLQTALSYRLNREGYEVRVASDGAEALRQFRLEKPNLVLLDIMLPILDGFEVCRTLRRESNVPIIMLTARDEEMDKVTGFDLGADDYVTKPFSMLELIARVRASLRHEHNVIPDSPNLSFGEIIVDAAHHVVTRSGNPLQFTPKEFDLLYFMASNKGLVLSREQILEHVWGYNFAGSARTVDVHVRWLREKIEPDCDEPQYLITVRGVGYKLVC
jgi:DNA-binding response OmpR family regulator